MKRFIFSVVCVSVFFVGLGALVDKAGAKFKSDEKALELVRKARAAIGGESALAGVQSMTIVGKTTHTLKVDGVERSHQGETEIAMQLPDKLMKTIKIGEGDESAGAHKMINKQIDVVVAGKAGDHQKVMVKGEGSGVGVGTRIVIKKDDGTVQELTGAEADKFIVTEDGQGDNVKRIVIKDHDGTVETGTMTDKVVLRTVDGEKGAWTTENGKVMATDGNHVFMRTADDRHAGIRQNELLRLTLGLLMTAPQAMDVSYTFGGESSVDGTACNIVIAEFGGSSFKIYLGQASNLPVMMSYSGMKMPVMVTFNKETAPPADGSKKTMIFDRSGGPAAEKAEFNVKFSDYRSVGGIQLPYKWTQTVGGTTDETFDVTSYEINPANIGEQFQHQKGVMVRTAIPEVQ